MLLPKLGGFWLLPPRDFSHVRVTLWITTAFHLDTPKLRHDPKSPGRRCWCRNSHWPCFYRGGWHGVQRFYDYRPGSESGLARPRNCEIRGDPRYGRSVWACDGSFPSGRKPRLPIERDRKSRKGVHLEIMNGNSREIPHPRAGKKKV